MENLTSILVEDPDLGEDLSERRLAKAQKDCMAHVLTAQTGPWPGESHSHGMRYGIGLLVLDGLLIRRVGLNRRFGAELLGAGDLLRPWESEDVHTTLPYTGGWRILQPARLAVLDGSFAIRVTRYPEVTSALFGRAIRRSRHLAVNMAIVHHPRIDIRLHMLLWTLADRWGKVGRDGVRLPIRLTHATLGELVAAHRPSVTKALAELSERSVVSWTGESWLLRGTPPVELGDVHEMSLSMGPHADGGAGGDGARSSMPPIRAS